MENNYEILGLENDVKAPLIWLIHGAGGSLRHFDTVNPILTNAGYRVLVNDVRYHGLSQPRDGAEGPFEFTSVIQDLNSILQQVKQEHYPDHAIKLILGGLSMGGVISLLFGSKHNVWGNDNIKLEGIVLLASGIPYLEVPRLGWDLFKIRQVTPEMLEGAREAVMASAITPYGKEQAKLSMDQMSHHALYECFVAIAELYPTPATPPKPYKLLTTVPMLLLIPDQDPYTKVEMEALHAVNLEHGVLSTIKTVENSGHLVTLDQGKQVGIEIREFFYPIL